MPVYKDEQRGTWYASFYYEDWQGNRKKKKKRGFKTQKEAKQYEREFLNNEQGQCDITFQTLVDEYLKDCENRLKKTTMANKRELYEKKVLPYFKNLKINKIAPTTIRMWQQEMLKKGYAPTYLKTIHNQLSAILNWAVKYYGLPNNPCHITGSIGKKDADDMQIWTRDEFEKFIAVEDKPAAKVAFEILFWCGLRVGELLALTPKDVLPDRSIAINKTFTVLEGEEIISEPKTPKSKRIVPIPEFLYTEIIEYTSRLYGLKEDDRIFYFTKSYLTKEMARCSKLAGVKKIRIHDLRHSHASLLIEMGYNVLLVSERMGHERVETTMNTYGHLYPNKQKQLVEDLEKLRN